MIKQFDKFIIKCDDSIDKSIFDFFCKSIENEFKHIDSFFNIDYPCLNISLVSKAELDLIVKKESIQLKNKNIPSWLVGFSTFKQAYIVIPTSETVSELYKVALHEIVHLISYQLGTKQKRLKLLDEGIAIFLSNQYAGKVYTPWVNAYLDNTLPHVSDFCVYDGLEFANKKGYRFSHCIIEYLIKKYGTKLFLNWLQDPSEFIEKLHEIDKDFEKYIVKEIERRISTNQNL